jgi:hypothetical protein
MADIPQQAIGSEIETMVKRQCQLHYAKIARQVSAIFGNGLRDQLAKLRRQFCQLVYAQRFDVRRRIDFLKPTHRSFFL